MAIFHGFVSHCQGVTQSISLAKWPALSYCSIVFIAIVIVVLQRLVVIVATRDGKLDEHAQQQGPRQQVIFHQAMLLCLEGRLW